MQKLIDSLCYLWKKNWVNEIFLYGKSWLLCLNGRKTKTLKIADTIAGKILNTWEIANSVPTGNNICDVKITSYIIID